MSRGVPYPIEQAIPLLADALAYYEQTDVERWFERNKRITGHYPWIFDPTIEAVRVFKMVPNEPFRKAWIQHNQPLVMGRPGTAGHRDGKDYPPKPEVCSLFAEEMQRVLALPETPIFPTPVFGPQEPPYRHFRGKKKVGPSVFTEQRIGEYVKETLGMMTTKSGRHLAWLVPYEVAEALCATLGLTPIHVGI